MKLYRIIQMKLYMNEHVLFSMEALRSVYA